MTAEIENVKMGQSGYHSMALATSGVYTFAAVMTLLRDDDVFITHVDPTRIRSHRSSVDLEAQDFVEYWIDQINRYKPNAAINAVFLIGGCNNNSYRQLSQNIDVLRESTVIARSKNVTTEQLHEFLRKIRLNLMPFNIQRMRATDDHGHDEEIDEDGSDSEHDYLSDCTILYDRASVPPTFIIAQRAGKESELNGDTTTTCLFAVYEVNVALNTVSATIYPEIKKSAYSSKLIEMLLRSVTDPLLVTYHDVDLTNNDKYKVLLSRVNEHTSSSDNDE
jgi:hypothetical protein